MSGPEVLPPEEEGEVRDQETPITGAVMVRPGPARGAFDLPVEVFRGHLEQAQQNRQALLEWIRKNLVDGTPACYPDRPERPRFQQGGRWQDNPRFNPDLHAMKPAADFGRVYTGQGWSKPTLFKPGAEKILGMLRFVPTWPELDRYVEAALQGVQIRNVVMRCEIIDGGGRVVGQGIGAAGVDDDLNRALKMAKKSSLIDAVLATAGISEVFTQDLDDLAPSASGGQPAPESSEARTGTGAGGTTATPRQGSSGRRAPLGPRTPPPSTGAPSGSEAKGSPDPAAAARGTSEPEGLTDADREPAGEDGHDYVMGLARDVGMTNAQLRLLCISMFPELKTRPGPDGRPGGFRFADLPRWQAHKLAEALEIRVAQQQGEG